MGITGFLGNLSNLLAIIVGAIALVSLAIGLRVRQRQGKTDRIYERLYSERVAAILHKLRTTVRDVADCFEARKISSIDHIIQDIQRDAKEPSEVPTGLDQIKAASQLLTTWFYHYREHLQRSNEVDLLLQETAAFMRSAEHLVEYSLKPVVESSKGLTARTAEAYEQFRTKYNYFKERIESLMRTATEELGRQFPDYFEFMPEMRKA